jgi:hypothetical protein
MKNTFVISVEIAQLGYSHGFRGLRALVTRGIIVQGGVKFQHRFYDTSAQRVSQLATLLATPPRDLA